MKIKAAQIKPGMVISVKRNKFNNVFLVTAITGYDEIEYTHLNIEDAYGGLRVGSMDGKTKVKVLTGEQRNYVIKKINEDVFKNLHDINNAIDTIRLIEAMS